MEQPVREVTKIDINKNCCELVAFVSTNENKKWRVKGVNDSDANLFIRDEVRSRKTKFINYFYNDFEILYR